MAEKDIEQELIQKLVDLKYEYLPDICDRKTLEANFRKHFEAHNQVKLTDAEFARLLEMITSADVFIASKMLREMNTLHRDDGTPLNFTLVNIKDWCKNSFEVVNQLRTNTDYSYQKHDVTLLINGVPVVQIELKTYPFSPKAAMEQIVKYKNQAGNGYARTLLCFTQLFVVSNKEDTFYFANNNEKHFAFKAEERYLPIYQHALEDNSKVRHLHDFARLFLSKCVLGQMISQYMVLLASEQKLMVMRPYQIYAVKAIVECIRQNLGNGYIWHTTGSGKTLTSFKASTLLKDNPEIDKCLFVVDRKDLDRQTREEFNRFQNGCVEWNSNTHMLVGRMLSTDKADKVIVTTIQKLGKALSDPKIKDRLQRLSQKRFVFIFDECHRSQFGENHREIRNFFPKAQLFGFTGTPIFEENAVMQQRTGDEASNVTTLDVFQKLLHAYTITHAIEDRNVLQFHVDYFKPEIKGDAVPTLEQPKEAVVASILSKHNNATANRKFNALFATGSINDAIAYYKLFAEAQTRKAAAEPDYTPLNIACVFSPPPGVSDAADQLREDLQTETDDYKHDPSGKQAALLGIINAYNAQFCTNFTLADFDGYYQDVQKRIKDQQYPASNQLPKSQKLDLVLVVDMLLTGFDSKYLNTLYVHKKLKHHGLIQAFSRTNRILNETKPFGNILDFLGQQDAVNEAITLFSGEQGPKAKEIWLVERAPVVVGKLETALAQLHTFLETQGVPPTPEGARALMGNEARIEFVQRFKVVQALANALKQYTDLTPEEEAQIATLLVDDEQERFRAAYLATTTIIKQNRPNTGTGDPDHSGGPDVIGGPAHPEGLPPREEVDFAYSLFASNIIDYDYIMRLIAQYAGQPPDKQEMSRSQLVGLIAADAKFMDEREDIEAYIRTLTLGVAHTEDSIRKGYAAFREKQNDERLTAVATTHGLTFAQLQPFVQETMDRMIFDALALTDLLHPLGLGWKARRALELALMADLLPLLKRLAKGRPISGLETYED